MRRIFQAYVDQLIECRDEVDLRQCLADATAALDLCCFAYLSLPRTGEARPSLISTYPAAWTCHYIENHYERFDPVVVQALKCPRPFRWGPDCETVVQPASACELFEEAARFGIRCGFTIPVHDSGGAIAAVTFAANGRGPSFEVSIERHASALQVMAMYFHAHAQRKLAPGHVIDGASLSRREIECLRWAAEGKSAWDVGRIMGISRHTVAFHLENAKAKLGVRSTIQAVAKLLTSRHHQ